MEDEYEEDDRFYGRGYGHGAGRGYAMHGMMHSHGMGKSGRFRTGFGLRYFILAVTAKGKATGGEIANSIEEISNGNWRPGPGSIYMMLKNMVEEGYLQVEETEGKKYYKITEEGRKLINNSWFPFKSVMGLERRSSAEESISIIEDAAQSLLDSDAKLGENESARITKIISLLGKLVQ